MQILTICGNEQNQKNLLVQNKQVSFLLDQKKKKAVMFSAGWTETVKVRGDTDKES